MSKVYVANHPLVQDRLTQLRDKSTDIGTFRRAMADLGYLLFYEAARNLPVTAERIETPMAPMQSPRLNPTVVLVAVLRAGLGFLDGVLAQVPIARVGYLGLKRDPKTLEALSYYKNLPEISSADTVFVLDPMLATGHTAIAALKEIEAAGAQNIHLIALLASPQGIETVQRAFPNLEITTAAIDPILNEKGYIIPGLGDAGDRLYGTLGH
ncbi:MAG: uracil phosphoribosyltransferase [Proteobacteria bacterium]|nr:MAG: uracil phosphoribosyltransferase [Pseudomonadota bacterium]